MVEAGRVESLLRRVLRVSDGVPLERASLDAWDSLRHIDVIFALEDEFDVRIPEDRFASLDSLEAICVYLRDGS